MHPRQGQCNQGVTTFDGARGKKHVWRPMFETEVFRKQMHCIEESTCDNVGTFWCPHSHSALPAVIWRTHSDSAPGELRPPYPPR